MTDLQFGILVASDVSEAPSQEITGRVVTIEDLGFDRAVLPDRIGNPTNADRARRESWAVMTGVALATSRIRISMQACNPYRLPPAVLARRAITLDRLCAGRLEVDVGAATFASGPEAAMANEPVEQTEQTRPLAEYVAKVDSLMRAVASVFAHEGMGLSPEGVAIAPSAAQRLRPPLILGGRSPYELRIAATYADTWNTHGSSGIDCGELAALTARQNRLLDHLCQQAGRDPASLTRSLSMSGPVDPWRAHRSFDEIVDQFAAVGITEFVVGWPPPGRYDEVEAIANRIPCRS